MKLLTFVPPLTAAGQPCQKCAKFSRLCPQHKSSENGDAEQATAEAAPEDVLKGFLVKQSADDPRLIAAFPAHLERDEPGRLAAFEQALRDRHAREHPGEGLLRQQSPDRSYYQYRRG